jgi:hypothetical protein
MQYDTGKKTLQRLHGLNSGTGLTACTLDFCRSCIKRYETSVLYIIVLVWLPCTNIPPSFGQGFLHSTCLSELFTENAYSFLV